ncbi:MAG: glycerol-3-phosphate acyltransferase [Leptolyngbyaceae cyanobacterium RM2_2_4]|nr:glycerol-3-phosphate acyltransferase [Leptolyngbyaceae cyanobacterium SM1_4_3]NJN89206.1 glycerol-3-phosphate acyltransferase [Leptolyngbyaceae cyanobacterium SL_5_14]NJO52585.1 glycerol-3-phosphate acyltransferase [Leptolyngbyaceae cyanobacterium RM2_2_4]NJO67377.1 glycerol-3-phosphate acyltransferase [Leptolyngbyaceae cyanobacterium RM1_405_57]
MAMWAIWGGIVVVTAYLLGAIPTGYWIGRLKGIDIRQHGSGSTGATNVLRTLGKLPALAVLLIDVLKGVAAIAFTRWLYSLPVVAASTPASVNLETWVPWAVTIAGLLAIFGHSKSIWIGFSGGKSVAAGLGVLLAMSWIVGLGALSAFGVTLALFKIVSLGSIVAAIAGCILIIVLNQPLPYQLLAIAGGLYVIWRHRSNIQRLMAGTEPRIGQKLQEPEDIAIQ